MSSGSSASFCLIVCFLVGSSGGHENITAKPGGNVTLRCKADNNNKPISAVEWNRPGLKPDHVLFYRDGHFVPSRQHPSYKNRVDLEDREMNDGDVSLVLKNVTMEDEGTYKCRVFQRRTNHRKRSILKTEPIRIFNLKVLPPGDTEKHIGYGGAKDGGAKDGGDKDGGDKDGGDKDGISRDGGTTLGIILGDVGFLLLVVTLVGFLIYKRRNMRQNPNLPVPPDEAAAGKTVDMN